MNYQIMGGNLPVVELRMEPGEKIRCESGAMSWMTPGMQMETASGGLGRLLGRAISNEKLFQNTYCCVGQPGTIAFASSFPGSIIAVEVRPGEDLIAQKSAYLASTMGVELSVAFQRKLGSGLFGGEGFIMQRLSGSGLVFLEIDGSAVEKELMPGEQLVVDTGYLAMCSGRCSIDVQTVRGVKNVLFGGEGLFNTVVTGPGRVVLQTMPITKVAEALIPFFPTGGSDK